jgi:hypothetical protein
MIQVTRFYPDTVKAMSKYAPHSRELMHKVATYSAAERKVSSLNQIHVVSSARNYASIDGGVQAVQDEKN